MTEFYLRKTKDSPRNSPFVDDRIFIPQQDNIWGTKNCGLLTATANKFSNTTSIHLVYSTSHLLLLYNYALHCTANTIPHKSNSKELVHRRETEGSAFCVLLAMAKLPSKVGMNTSNTQLFRLAIQCTEDSSRKGKLYKWHKMASPPVMPHTHTKL